MPFCWFCHEAAHIIVLRKLRDGTYSEDQLRPSGKSIKFFYNVLVDFSVRTKGEIGGLPLVCL